MPMARPGTRGAWCHGLRLMALDGLVLDVAATPDHDTEFDRSGNDTTTSPLPQVRVVALGECGTHAVVDAALGGISTGEQTLATELIARFTPGTLVLADRTLLRLSGLAAGLHDRGGAAVAGHRDPHPARRGVAARRLLPIRADQPDHPRTTPRSADRRRHRRARPQPRPGHDGPRRGVHDRKSARQRGTVLPDHQPA